MGLEEFRDALIAEFVRRLQGLIGHQQCITIGFEVNGGASEVILVSGQIIRRRMFEVNGQGIELATGRLPTDRNDARDRRLVGKSKTEPPLTLPMQVHIGTPFGSLDFSDVVSFLALFSTMDPAADLAPPMGVHDFSDVAAFLASFGSGCPS